jgi:hypothetical protein
MTEAPNPGRSFPLPPKLRDALRALTNPFVLGALGVAVVLGVVGTLGVQGIASTSRHATAAHATKPKPTPAEKKVYAPLFPKTATVKDAEAQLDEIGLTYQVVAVEDGTPSPAWYVTDATPSGENVSPGTRVTLTAHAPASVPNLVGSTIAQAEKTAQAAGISLDVSGFGDDWKIDSQDIPPGTALAPGTLVGLEASEPPQFDTYRVTGNGTAGVITYSTGGTGSSQASGVRLPWSFQVPAGSGFLYVSAQDGSGTSITCTITGPDGSVIATNTATGRYSIAQCNG